MSNKSYVEPVYLISAVAQILDIHPQTLRQYEREGLITPSRSNGKIRLYSQKDIDHIKTVLSLTRDLGVNLAGVDIILKLNKRIEKLENDIEHYKNRFRESDDFCVVPSSKALVVKKSSYKVIVVEEDDLTC